MNRLIAHVLDQRPHKNSYLHGEQHWKCVARVGADLLPHVGGADALVVFLFGLLHDARRLDDGHDPQHGPRAATLAQALNGDYFHLSAGQLKSLCHACEHHTRGGVTSDPTSGLCWDSDRLNLWRIGARPMPRYLSTAVARREPVIESTRDLHGRVLAWDAIYRDYGLAGSIDESRVSLWPSGLG